MTADDVEGVAADLRRAPDEEHHGAGRVRARVGEDGQAHEEADVVQGDAEGDVSAQAPQNHAQDLDAAERLQRQRRSALATEPLARGENHSRCCWLASDMRGFVLPEIILRS